MERRQIPWERVRSIKKILGYTGLASLLFTAALLTESCRSKEVARLTTVYGKVQDENGLSIDSINVVMAGAKGLTGGIPIADTYTNFQGEYELVVNVPKEFHTVGVNVFPGNGKHSTTYYSYIPYQGGVQKTTCCTLPIGGKGTYDFILLAK